MLKKTWTKAEEDLIRELYPNTRNEIILAMLEDVTLNKLYSKANSMGVKKSAEYMAEWHVEWADHLRKVGKANQFKKGQVAFNKGMKQEEFLTKEAIERTKDTRFKKGNLPHNTKFDGAITIRTDSSGRKTMWIRLAKAEWKEYHAYLWEKKHGPVPADSVLSFRDGNSLNPHPSNLECITRVELVNRNKDREKASATLKAIHAGLKMPKPLTPGRVATMLACGDKELRKHLLNNEPELLKVAMLNYQLKREIKYGSA